MSEEAELIIWALKWLILCMKDQYVIKGRILSYFAYECNLESKQTHMIWQSMDLKQEGTPPDVIYFSRSAAEGAEEFNHFDWMKDQKWRVAVIV